MKEQKQCKYYYRYCDDIVVLASNKKRLHELKDFTEKYFETIKLKLKDNWQVFPVDKRGIDFLGYRFFHDYTLLRKNIAKRLISKCEYIKQNHKQMNAQNIISTVMSYLGWLQYANSKNLINNVIDDDMFWIVKYKSRELNINNPLQGAV